MGLLEKARDDVNCLVDGFTKFVNWWCDAKRMISVLDKRMFVCDQSIHPIRLEMAQEEWERVRQRYEIYNRTVSCSLLRSDMV